MRPIHQEKQPDLKSLTHYVHSISSPACERWACYCMSPPWDYMCTFIYQLLSVSSSNQSTQPSSALNRDPRLLLCPAQLGKQTLALASSTLPRLYSLKSQPVPPILIAPIHPPKTAQTYPPTHPPTYLFRAFKNIQKPLLHGSRFLTKSPAQTFQRSPWGFQCCEAPDLNGAISISK